MLVNSLVFALFVAFVLFIVRTWRSSPKSLPPGYNKMGSGEMFDGIAPFYDTANRFMSLGLDQSWRRQLVKLLNLQASDRVLDVSTGTGDVAILIAKKMQSLGKKDGQPITGFDPSNNMLSFAASKLEQEKLTSMVKLIQGDAQHMKGIGSNSFDKITMSFGIRNVPDRKKALKELYRVARRKSTVIVMEFFAPLGVKDGILSSFAEVFVKLIVPAVGTVISGGHTKAYNHLSDSIFNFPSTDDFRSMMESSGFSQCRVESVFFNVVCACVCTK